MCERRSVYDVGKGEDGRGGRGREGEEEGGKGEERGKRRKREWGGEREGGGALIRIFVSI